MLHEEGVGMSVEVDRAGSVRSGVSQQGVRNFLQAVDGIGNPEDTLSVVVDYGEPVPGGGTFTLVDSAGFPLFTVALFPEEES